MKPTTRRILVISICLILIAVGAALIVMGGRMRAEKERQANEVGCFQNIQLIDTAKESYLLLKEEAVDGPIQPADIASSFTDGELPVCPAGGEYVLGEPGDIPNCTAHESMCSRIRVNEQALHGTQHGFALYVEDE
jgi:hypothetical protein